MSPATSPTGRALLALELVQASPGITAERLGERLGVSERAARRYVSILREAGIPVDSVRGPYGGYRVGRGLRLPPLVFSATEALGLVMAVLDGHHLAADPTDPVGAALGKIMRALPEPVAAQAESVRRATAAAPDRGAARPDPRALIALVEALTDRRPVRFGYRSEAGRQWDVDADPWAVVVRHGRWYLLCFSHRAQDRRAYRIDRVHDVHALDGSVTLPANLDPVGMLEDHLAIGWEYKTQVSVQAPAALARGWLPRALGRVDPVDEATCHLVGSTSDPYWYAQQLLGIQAPYRVLGCPELRAAARALGTRLMDAVQDPPG